LQFGAIQAWSAAIREIRQSHQIPPREAIQFTSEPGDDSLQQHARYFEIFANASLTDDATATRIATAQVDARTLVVFGQVGDADHQAERDRLTRRLDEVRKSVATLQGRLNNTGYTDKAPAHLVQQTRDQLAAAGQEADALESQIAALE
jgi:valyl-tRNA synthetase